MRDGLYRVTTRTFCAGFVVYNGKPIKDLCAPILRKRITYWLTVAEWVCE